MNTISCIECSKKFESEYKLLSHKAKVHMSSNDSSSKIVDDFTTNSDGSEESEGYLSDNISPPIPSPPKTGDKMKGKIAKISKSARKYENDDLEVAKWRRKYDDECQSSKRARKDSKSRIKELDLQLKELKEFDDECEVDSLTKSVINSKTMNDIKKVLSFIDSNKFSYIMRSSRYLNAIQKLFLGLSYGIIPITASQRKALSKDERDMVIKLENATSEKVKKYIAPRKAVFMKLMSVIESSIKLVLHSYEIYKV